MIIKKIKRYIPIGAFICFVIAVCCGIVQIISINSVSFSDFFNRYISSFFRAALAYITNLIPLSVAETAVLTLPLIVFTLMYFGIRAIKKSFVHAVRYICGMLAALMCCYSLFVLTFATGYHGTDLDEKLGLECEEVSAEQLYNTALYLSSQLDSVIDEIDFVWQSYSVMPYSLSEMNKKLNDAYIKLCDKYSFVQKLNSNVKFIMLSEPMTYTHISGVYTFFTGEANLNINFPDYTLPYTAAHEMSHQRGIAPEDEANFMAFLVCCESDDAYIRYSGYANMLEYVMSSLYSADKELYYSFIANVDKRVRYEFSAYNDFYDKYKQSVASKVSTAVNDTYLKVQGESDGTKSYGLVVDLTVAYYEKYYSEQTE